MGKISRKNYLTGLKILALILVFSFAMSMSYVYGEQAGGSTESGSTSHIKDLYTSLQTAGLGSDTNTPDWGPYWNRISTASKFTPVGTATPSDVINGKTFYGSDRNKQTGTYRMGYCPTQQYIDAYGAPVTQTTNCTNTITWTEPTDNIPGTEKQDPISGLIWSNHLTRSSNNVLFSTTSYQNWSWDASDPDNIAVGNKTASQLCSERGNGWRLPTQKEALQAYIDGSYFNLSRSNVGIISSTLRNDSLAFFYINNTGTYEYRLLNSETAIRCVR